MWSAFRSRSWASPWTGPGVWVAFRSACVRTSRAARAETPWRSRERNSRESRTLRPLQEVAELPQFETVRDGGGSPWPTGGSSLVARSKVTRVPSGSTRTIRACGLTIAVPRRYSVRRLAAAHVAGLERELDAGPVGSVPQENVLGSDPGQILLGVEEELEDVGCVLLLDLRDDLRGLGGRQVGVEDRGADPDPLLAAGLSVGVEPGTVEESGKDVRDLPSQDAGAVVLDRDPASRSSPSFEISTRSSGRMDASSQPSRLLSAASLTVVSSDALRVVEPQDLTVPLEELRDGDLALLRRELLGDCGRRHHRARGSVPLYKWRVRIERCVSSGGVLRAGWRMRAAPVGTAASGRSP